MSSSSGIGNWFSKILNPETEKASDKNIRTKEKIDSFQNAGQSFAQTSGSIFLETESLPDGSSVEIAYDKTSGKRVGMQTYDSQGNLQEAVKDVYDEHGVLTSRMIYDENGELSEKMTFENDPLSGIQKTTTTDAYGNVTGISESSQNPDGSRTNINKDAQGNVLNSTLITTTADGLSNMIFYDSNGRRTGTQLFNNEEVVQTTNDVYNSSGQLTKIIFRDSEGEISSTSYFDYDSDGHITKTTNKDSEGNITETLESTYNADGTRTTVRKNGDGEIIETVILDENDNIIQQS